MLKRDTPWAQTQAAFEQGEQMEVVLKSSNLEARSSLFKWYSNTCPKAPHGVWDYYTKQEQALHITQW